jgi:hypothetical protein
MASAADDERKLYTNDKIPQDSEYICDLCAGRFDSSNKLHEHRDTQHKASVE